ncbi:glycosyltransferase family 87 protein [Polynucleobacter sp. UB-Tiil-W10]|uniref:glycosyltransferase family 87 protein n=1 Tax=Polynucleobacter sp. UB-Tiil-W10 TaxID=1855648 RepID=UPI001C0D4A97|nr:glycosyltransferase family 87 protein [Polynucleobacter sp. UB-Tiil-W10]MBU3540237.1 DUF2029 domain-containing protein [Polynucleobacter sp. UB-Tiil-W10]
MNSNTERYWLNKERLRIYPRIILAILLLCTLGIYLFIRLNGDSFYYENDYSIFWTVSRLSLEGKSILAYDYLFLLDKVREIAPVVKSRWFYFPTYDLFILPIGLLPYGASYLLFMATTYCAYATVIWRILPYKETMWWLAVFGGAWINLRFGQNGFITAALVGAALMNINKRPAISGIFIGLLTIKPQLVILFPVALIACKAWRTLIFAVITAVLFLSISTYLIGMDSLIASLDNIAQARALIESEGSNGFWQIMPTFFALCRLSGAPVFTSYLVHYFFAAFAVLSTWIIWKNTPNSDLRNATLIICTLLVSPYLHVYDLTWLALAIAWFIRYGMQTGWRNGEREVLIGIWILPFVDVPISRYFDIQIGPIIVFCFLLILMKRYQINLRCNLSPNKC